MRGKAGVPRGGGVLGPGRTRPCRSPRCASPTGDGEEEEEEAKQSHAQRKLKAFGLRVRLFFDTM